MTPSWQLSQVPIVCVWSVSLGANGAHGGGNWRGSWQASHWSVELIWFGPLPCAIVPLWQLTHEPITSEWFTALGATGAQDAGAGWWQALHWSVAFIWVAILPDATKLLWQLTQAPLTCEWSTSAGRTGTQELVLVWQASQMSDVLMWLACLPVAVNPLWQSKQACPITFEWSKANADQLVTEWHAPQSRLVGTWFDDLPVAKFPSWQNIHCPTTSLWSTVVAGLQKLTLWQNSHRSEVGTWLADLPVAVTLSWQATQDCEPTILWSINVAENSVKPLTLWQASHESVIGIWFEETPTANTPSWQASHCLGNSSKIPPTWQDSQSIMACAPSSAKPVVRWSKVEAVGSSSSGAENTWLDRKKETRKTNKKAKRAKPLAQLQLDRVQSSRLLNAVTAFPNLR